MHLAFRIRPGAESLKSPLGNPLNKLFRDNTAGRVPGAEKENLVGLHNGLASYSWLFDCNFFEPWGSSSIQDTRADR